MGIPMDEIVLRALAGAALLGAACGPVGAFVLWRRMAYIGASIAHMALLGAALGLVIGVAPIAGVVATSVLAATLMVRAEGSLVPADTLIGIIGHAGLALGFILLATLETMRADLMGYLFGDVLALEDIDIALVAIASVAALATLAAVWRPLLAGTVSPDIAAAEGIATGPARAAFLVLVALLVAFGLKVVGALLIVALLIVPPAAARPLARSPETMAVLAALFGALAAPLGLWGAFAFDVPAGPAIVLAAAFLFLVSLAAARLRPGIA